MTKQIIDLGTAPTGAGGDTPRSAFIKVQSNFNELYSAFYAGKGANTDITSLSGLTTSLTIAQGGTGSKTAAGLLDTLLSIGALGRSNMVGIVSQSNGAPTGAVVETGSNANGTFTKFADGTMICVGSCSAFWVPANTTAQLVNVPFPAVFVSPFYGFSIMGTPNLAADFYGCIYNSKTTSGFTATFRNGATAQTVVNTTFCAIGRWF